MIRIDPNDIDIHLNEIPPQGFEFETFALDTEWFGQDVNHLHRPHGKFASLAATNNGRDVWVVFDENKIQPFMDAVNESTQIWHNAQYDIRQLRKYAHIPDRKLVWDSMLVEQIRYSGYYNSFALNDVARRYLGIYLDKSERESFSQVADGLTDEQIFYAAADVIATYYVGKEQRAQIDEDDLNIWNHVERPFLYTLLSTQGIPFDAGRWMKRASEDRAKADELDAKLPFNPRSYKQVIKFFKDKYKLKLASTDEKHLMEALENNPDIEEIAMILDARGLSKAAGTYGQSWADEQEEDGCIYPSWKQIGAETGRMSASGLAIQTIPHADEYRGCFTASEGHTLWIGDYSSQEPRILAYVTGDPKLAKIFSQGKDIYISIGYEVFGEVFDKKDPRRQAMKSIILGVSYGMSRIGLAAKLGMSEDEAEDLLGIFFRKFPTVKDWVDDCQKWKPYTTTILGRKFWGNPYMNGWERNYQNMPMQGSAVDCTKIAASKVCKKLGYNPFLIYMHDELVANIPTERLEEDGEKIKQYMIETQEWMHPGIPGGIESFIGPTWASKQ